MTNLEEAFLGEVDAGLVDVTDRVDEYKKGKTFECDCGHGIGVEHEVAMVRCYSCGSNCVDRKFDERSEPEREEEQSSLGQWS